MALSKITNASVADTAVHGRRNLIINGGMEVQQYGSSGTKTGGNGYGGYLSVDRWAGYYNNTTFATQTPVRLDGNLLTPLRVSHSNSSNTNLYVYQNIEDGMKKYAGQTLTISLYARGSSAMTISGDNSVRAVSAGNAATDSRVGDYTSISITTSWQRYTRTITLNSSYTSGNDHLMILFSDSNQPSSAWLEITGVQLELGDTATPFEHRSFAEEKLLCQRYYYTSWPYGTSTSTDLTGDNNNNGILMDVNDSRITMGQAFLPVDMRAIPTVSVRSPSGVSGKFYDHQSDTDLGFSLTGSQIQPSTSAIVVYEYDGSATPQRPAYVHIFCDAEL